MLLTEQQCLINILALKRGGGGLSSAEGLLPGYSNKIKNAFFLLLPASLRHKQPSTKESGSGWKNMRHRQTFFSELRLMYLEIELHNCQYSLSKQQQNTKEIQS